MSLDLSADVIAISEIGAVPTILEVVCRTTGMGFAAVARVTEDRWVACDVRDEIAFGLRPHGELEVETTICREVRRDGEAVIIDHVSEDVAYCGHPTPALYGFQSYVSMPIVLPGGEFFGTLCAIDRKPAKVSTPEMVGMFKLFAELIGFHVDAHRRVADSEARLDVERRDAELREQFIAVLGHDLRNPLASIQAGATLLGKESLSERGRSLLLLMRGSIGRMSALIYDVLDLARGRLGGGIPVELVPAAPIAPRLRAVVDELRLGRPDRVIEMEIGDTGDLRCDPARIEQLLSNLVANALSHGSATSLVTVRGSRSDGRFELSVANGGDPIPRATLDNLFKPFVRDAAKPGAEGLGLGLFIASEIAKAHHGELVVASTTDETRFTFRMPVA